MVNQILDKADNLIAKGEFACAEMLLNECADRFREAKDTSSLLTILNELIGFYRKQNNEKCCLSVINEVINLLLGQNTDKYINYGIIFINIATGYTAFNYFSEAEVYFNKALSNYNKNLAPTDSRFGALYNNFAGLYVGLKDYTKAREFYYKALEIAENYSGTELDKAMTLLNIADTYSNDFTMEQEVDKLVNEAYILLKTEGLVRDSYYSFVAKKCAESFLTHGYILMYEELQGVAKQIDETYR